MSDLDAYATVQAQIARHYRDRWGGSEVIDALDVVLYNAARSPALFFVVWAIEAHRDAKYEGGVVSNRADARLYNVALWVRAQQQEIDAA